jgi:RNA polymerase sigma-70 factor (ECF subfamily)
MKIGNAREIDPNDDAEGPTDSAAPSLPWDGALYEELSRVVTPIARRESGTRSFRPSDVVQETYLRLREGPGESMPAFRARAVETARRVLVDAARRRRAAKRGGGQSRVPLDEASLEASPTRDGPIDLVDIDEALTHLARVDARAAKVIELRFFGECTVAETAAELGICERSASADFVRGISWLRERLQR